jgi:hypothetical protein
MVKVISFSLWGDQLKYTIGAIKNANLVKEFYPDFQCWFYIHKPTVPQNIIDELSNKENVKIIFKDGDLNTSKPMMWRFEPIINPEVEIMMSRDTDTRILLREKLAVDEWLKSDKLLHIMRDNPYHYYNILGGMFGIKQNNLINWKCLMDNTIQNGNRDYDQTFLCNNIYLTYLHTSLIHASYHRREHHATNFPIIFSPTLNFVGEYVYEDESRVPEHYNLCSNNP